MRPLKKSIDYFSLDVDIADDDKITLIEAQHGVEGFGVIIRLLCRIYKDKGYYYKWNERTKLLFSKRVGLKKEHLESIVRDAIKWGFFNKKVFNKYNILTSARIQKNYLIATKRREEIEINEDFLVLDKETVVNLNDNVNINSLNVNNYSQSKVKHSKVKHSKVKHRRKTKEIIDDLNLVLGTRYKHTTQKTKDLIKVRFNEGFSVKDFKIVHRKMLKVWGADKKMCEFLRPITLYSNKFESYLNKREPITQLTKKGIEAYFVGQSWLKKRKGENVK